MSFLTNPTVAPKCKECLPPQKPFLQPRNKHNKPRMGEATMAGEDSGTGGVDQEDLECAVWEEVSLSFEQLEILKVNVNGV
jgi:hypothetical protein